VLTSDAANGNQWFLNGTLIPGANGQTYTMTGTGAYNDVVTLNGCSSDTSNTIVITGVAGIKSNSAISIYPIPNDGQFRLSITSNSRQVYSVRVLNNLGVMVYEQKDIEVTGTTEKIIDLRPVPSGTYTVIVRTNDEQVIRKIIVTK
jgi:hypothetical protein